MEVDSVQQSQALLTLVSSTSFVLHLLLALVFLGFAIGVVHPRRPDAGPTLIFSAGVYLLACLLPAVYFITNLLQNISGQGVTLMLTLSAFTQGLGLLLNIAWVVLLLIALVKLSRAPITPP